MTLAEASLDPEQCVSVAEYPATISPEASMFFIPLHGGSSDVYITYLVSETEAGLWTSSIINCDSKVSLSCKVSQSRPPHCSRSI